MIVHGLSKSAGILAGIANNAENQELSGSILKRKRKRLKIFSNNQTAALIRISQYNTGLCFKMSKGFGIPGLYGLLFIVNRCFG